MADAICEEAAFWSAEDSASPDTEVVAALRPALVTVPGARLYVISTPYARRGITFDAYTEHWGKDGDDVLVWCADTLSMNPTIRSAVIERAFADDAVAAASEYGRDGLVFFRTDVESWISKEAVQAVVVLDCVRETRPPFSPEQVTQEYGKLLRTYRISEIVGDRYAGEFPRELFRKVGIEYRPADFTTSDFYRELLPVVNAGRVELLEHPRVTAQLESLERHVGRTGKDTITHPPGGHDDLAAVVAGVVVRVLKAGNLANVVAPIELLKPGGSLWGPMDGGGGEVPEHWLDTPANDGYPSRKGFNW
jgi:hypothetical protein